MFQNDVTTKLKEIQEKDRKKIDELQTEYELINTILRIMEEHDRDEDDLK